MTPSWFPFTWNELLTNPVFQAQIYLPLLFILLDVVTGIASAVHRGTFDAKFLGNFLSGDLLKYAGGLILVLMSYFFHNNALLMSFASTISMGALGVSIVKSIWENLHELFQKNLPALAAADAVGAVVGIPDPLPFGSVPVFPPVQ